VFYNSQNKAIYKTSYADGKKIGLEFNYTPDGKLMSIRNYKSGSLNGLSVYYLSNKKINCYERYEMDKEVKNKLFDFISVKFLKNKQP